MGASITFAGEALIARKQAENSPLDIERFMLALVPGLDPTLPVNRELGLPEEAQVAFDGPVTKKAFLAPNQVVYSLSLGSDIGDWDFNWIGLVSAEGVIFAVAYVPVQQKRREIPPVQTGNNLTRNFLTVFDGAQALTGVTIPAETWQYDLTGKLELKLDKAALVADTVGHVALSSGNQDQPITWAPAGIIAGAAIPMEEPFAAAIGARYCLMNGALSVTLPTTAGLAPGQALSFIKAAGTDPIISVNDAATEIVKHNGVADTAFYLDINAEVFVVWNGEHWEI